MTLLKMAEILKPSVRNGWAVGGYDTSNLAVTYGILDAAEADNAPIIIMIYPGMTPPEYFATFAAFINKEVERRNVKAALILDHGQSISQVEYALAAGFSGVMIDASQQPLEKNIEISKKVVQMAHKLGVSVEAELGHVGLGSDVLPEDQMKALYTPVEDAERFVSETGVDALAVAIGTAHGLYKFKPQLDFERLVALRNSVDIPLVMHGSSGTPEDQIAEAVKLGINKINVYTDIRMAVLKQIQLKAINPIETYDIPDLDEIMRSATKQLVHEKNTLFNAVGKVHLY